MRRFKQFAFALLLIFFMLRPASAQTRPNFGPGKQDLQQYLPPWARTTRFPPFPELMMEEFPNWLVRAKVSRSYVTKNDIYFEMVITRSYSGPDLRGRTWQQSWNAGEDPLHLEIRKANEAPLHTGEEIICSVSLFSLLPNNPSAVEGHLAPSNTNIWAPYGLRWPAHMDGSAWAAEVSEFAEDVSKAYTCPTDQIEPLLNQYAVGQNELAADWATLVIHVGLIGYVPAGHDLKLRDRSASLALLWRLAGDPERSFAQQMSLDEILQAADKEKWNASSARFNLLNRLCAYPMNWWEEFPLMQNIFAMTYKQPTLSPAQFSALCQSFADNPSTPNRDKFLVIGVTMAKLKLPGEALVFWSEIISPRLECESATEIASQIVGFPPLSAENRLLANRIIAQWEVGAVMTNSETEKKKLAEAIRKVRAAIPVL